MKPKYIKEKLAEIKSVAWDDEAAHSREDDLLWEFIEFIAHEPTVPPRIRRYARMIMKSSDIKFSRWYA